MHHFLASVVRVMAALVRHRNSREFDDGAVEELLTRFSATSRVGIYLLYDSQYRDGKVPLYQLEFASSANSAQLYLDTCITDPLVKIAMLGVVALASLEQKRSFALSIKDERGPFKILFENRDIATQPPISKDHRTGGLRLAILTSAITVAEQLELEPLDDKLVRELWRCGFVVPAPIGDQRIVVKWQDGSKTKLLAEVHAQGYIAYPPVVDYSYPQFLLVCAAIWAMSAVKREPVFTLPNLRRYAAHLQSASVCNGVCSLKRAERSEAIKPTN